jgi:hypothetical protein
MSITDISANLMIPQSEIRRIIKQQYTAKGGDNAAEIKREEEKNPTNAS